MALEVEALQIVCPQCGARAGEFCTDCRSLHEARLRFGRVNANPLAYSSRPTGAQQAAAFFTALARGKSTRKQQGAKIAPSALPSRGPRRDFSAATR